MNGVRKMNITFSLVGILAGLSVKERPQNQPGKVTAAWKALATDAYHNKEIFPDGSSKKNNLEISTIITLMKQLMTAATECAQTYENHLTASGVEHEAHTVLLSSAGEPLEVALVGLSTFGCSSHELFHQGDNGGDLEVILLTAAIGKDFFIVVSKHQLPAPSTLQNRNYYTATKVRTDSVRDSLPVPLRVRVCIVQILFKKLFAQ